MGRSDDAVARAVDECALALGVAAPQDEDEVLAARGERVDDGIGEDFPAPVLVRARAVRCDGQRRVEEQHAFLADVTRVANALHKAFNPAKVNYGAYGDTGHHLHVHLVPKYKDGFEWGGTFEMNPQKCFLSDEEYQEIIDKIKANL